MSLFLSLQLQEGLYNFFLLIFFLTIVIYAKNDIPKLLHVLVSSLNILIIALKMQLE